MRSLLVAMVLWAPASALAWTHTGNIIALDELPLRWSVQADPQIPGMTREQILTDLQAVMAAWEDSSCGLQTEFLGELDYSDPNSVPAGQLHLVVASLGGSGAPWVRLGAPGDNEPLYVRDGRTYRRERLGAYAINADYGLISDEAILEGECRNEFALSLIAGALIGQRLGLGVSFEDGSIMSSRLRVCTTLRPGEDEAEGLDALYGPWVEVACQSQDSGVEVIDEVAGVVPFDVTCEASGDLRSALDDARWFWGDGGTGRGVDVEHRYERTGNHTIRVVAEGVHETCGPFERTVERFGYVRACGEPIVEFSVERVRGLEFQTRNDSNVRTFGCHTAVEWRAFDEDDREVLLVRAWEPRLVFPEPGVYRLELRVFGPGGTAASEIQVDTRQGSIRGFTMGDGCSTVGAPGGLLLPLAVLLGILGRRRR